MATIKEGIQQYANAALDTKDELAMAMMEAGVEPAQALIASTVVTKRSVAERLERHLGNRNAAEITTTLSDGVTAQDRAN